MLQNAVMPSSISGRNIFLHQRCGFCFFIGDEISGICRLDEIVGHDESRQSDTMPRRWRVDHKAEVI